MKISNRLNNFIGFYSEIKRKRNSRNSYNELEFYRLFRNLVFFIFYEIQTKENSKSRGRFVRVGARLASVEHGKKPIFIKSIRMSIKMSRPRPPHDCQTLIETSVPADTYAYTYGRFSSVFITTYSRFGKCLVVTGWPWGCWAISGTMLLSSS